MLQEEGQERVLDIKMPGGRAQQQCLGGCRVTPPQSLFLFTSVREGKTDERKLSSKSTFMNQKFIGVTYKNAGEGFLS